MGNDTPCGSCDVGVYSELAAMNKKAREFGALSEKDRCKNMPKCKHEKHVCYGARDYHNFICEIDKVSSND